MAMLHPTYVPRSEDLAPTPDQALVAGSAEGPIRGCLWLTMIWLSLDHVWHAVYYPLPVMPCD